MGQPPITPDEVRRIAGLARLALTDAEVSSLSGELGRIIDYVSQLSAIDLPELLPARDRGASDLRDDAPRPGLGVDEALDDAPAVERGHFVVPPVVGE